MSSSSTLGAASAPATDFRSSFRPAPYSLGPFGRVLVAVYVMAIGVPLFIYPTHHITNLNLIWDPSNPARADLQPLRVHWAVGMAGLFVLYLILRLIRLERPAVPPRSSLIAALLACFAIALLSGFSSNPSPLNLVYFVQTVVPIVGFFAAAAFVGSIRRARTLCFLLLGATVFSVAGIMLLALHYDVFSGDLAAANRLARAIPQVRDYYPFVVAVALALALALVRSETRVAVRLSIWCGILILLSFYAVNWSRMGMVMLAIVVIPPFFSRFRNSSKMARYRWSLVAIILLATVLAATQFGIMRERFTHSLSASDNRRVQYAVDAMKIIASHPLIGRGFFPEWDHDPFPNRDLRIRRIFRAHNQYLDYGVRAGLPPLLVLVVIIFAVGRDVRKSLKGAAPDSFRRHLLLGLASALVAAAVGNLTQLLLTQAQTGSLAWLLVGITVNVTRLGDSDTPERSTATELTVDGTLSAPNATRDA